MTVNHVWQKYNIHKIYKNSLEYYIDKLSEEESVKEYYNISNIPADHFHKFPTRYSINSEIGNVKFYDYEDIEYKNQGVIYLSSRNSKRPASDNDTTFIEGYDLYDFGFANGYCSIYARKYRICKVKSRTVQKFSHNSKGDYIEDIKSTNKNAYPDNGEKNGYWYIYKGIDNQAPTISGDNNDLGNKTDDFTVDYVITDSDNDTCTVDILVDGVKKVSSKAVTLGYKYSYDVKINDFNIGSHKIEIIAKDSKESTSETRRYTFYKPNIAPVISGEDADLGGKSSAFVVDYNVTDKNNDSVNVNVLLDDLEIQSITSAQNQELQVKITDGMLVPFEIGSNHTITIKADDLKGGVSYRKYIFTKTNRPPIISGADEDLGQKKETFKVSFSITDLEKDQISFKVYLDDKLVMQEDKAEDNKTYNYEIPASEFIKLDYSKHEIKVVATDDKNPDKKTVRKFKFERVTNGLDIEIKINEFDDKPKKIIAVPHGIIAEDATMHVYACNNYLDSNPTWEDMTTESKVARAHSFTNGSKTNTKWAISVKLTVENGTSGLGSVIRGFKGGYE